MKKNKKPILSLPTEINEQFHKSPMKIPYLFTKIETKDINNVTKPAIKMASCEKYNTQEYQCVTFYKPIAKF